MTPTELNRDAWQTWLRRNQRDRAWHPKPAGLCWSCMHFTRRNEWGGTCAMTSSRVDEIGSCPKWDGVLARLLYHEPNPPKFRRTYS